MNTVEESRVSTLALSDQMEQKHFDVFKVASLNACGLKTCIPVEHLQFEPELKEHPYMLMLTYEECLIVCGHKDIKCKKAVRTRALAWARRVLNKQAHVNTLNYVRAAIEAELRKMEANEAREHVMEVTRAVFTRLCSEQG